jgi:hypothetical protein
LIALAREVIVSQMFCPIEISVPNLGIEQIREKLELLHLRKPPTPTGFNF